MEEVMETKFIKNFNIYNTAWDLLNAPLLLLLASSFIVINEELSQTLPNFSNPISNPLPLFLGESYSTNIEKYYTFGFMYKIGFQWLSGTFEMFSRFISNTSFGINLLWDFLGVMCNSEVGRLGRQNHWELIQYFHFPGTRYDLSSVFPWNNLTRSAQCNNNYNPRRCWIGLSNGLE